MKKLLNVIIMFLPWILKKRVLMYMYGYKLGRNTHIGLSYVFPKVLIMGDGSVIKNFCYAANLDKIEMGRNSSINRGNWITGFLTGTDSKHFSHDKQRKSELIIGQETSITKNHHFDCTNSITIGNYTTIAGYDSQFLTHSIDIYQCRQDSHPICIGDYCFISTRVTVLGGSQLPSNSVLAAGAVLNKTMTKEWTIYAGVPAIEKKTIEESAKFFSRGSRYIY